MTQLSIQSIGDILTAIQDNQQLHIQGNGTKTGLRRTDCPTLDLAAMQGIIEYQADEYTFTAHAATSITEIQSALQAHGQYLPCDPILATAGATLGGTIAANTSGSRRFRYGGVRDFLLGARVVDAKGQIFTVGGKVVKNAAGFDLAKFLVGSLGQYMLMLDVTFKVFPDKPAFLTYQYDYAKTEAALDAIYYLNLQVFELDALDLEVTDDGAALIARFAGSSQTLAAQVERFSSALNQHSAVQTLAQKDDASYWQTINALNHAKSIVKVPLAPKQIPALDAQLGKLSRRYTVGGNIAWIETEDSEKLDTILADLQLTGLQILGNNEKPLLGKSIDNAITQGVQAVLNPHQKFI